MSNIQPKKFGVKLRHNFHSPSSFLDNRIFFEEKEQYRFAYFASFLPLLEQYKQDGSWLDRTLRPKFDHSGRFRRTFSPITNKD